MRRVRQTALLLLLAGSAPGCISTRPIKYYVLNVPPVSATNPSAQYPVRLLIERATTSHLYRDDRIVFGSGPVQVGTYEYERWAESPGDMIQDMLITSLRSTGQYLSVSRLRSSVRGDYIVRGRLLALCEIDQPELVGRFSLQIELFDPKVGTTVWSQSYSHDEPVNGKTVPDVIEALDRNVKVGMRQLTSGLGQYFASHPPLQQAPQTAR